MVGAVPSESDLAEARSLGIETCGRIASFWGFTRTMGRVFGLLYLSPDPMTAAEIKRAMGISVGNTSMTLSALQRWGVIQEVKQTGKRGIRYAAETDFWKMISEVLHRRERAEIVAAVSNVRRAGAHARLAMRRTGPQEKREAQFVLERLEHLRELSEMGEKMLEMLLGELSLDVGRFRHVFRGR